MRKCVCQPSYWSFSETFGLLDARWSGVVLQIFFLSRKVLSSSPSLIYLLIRLSLCQIYPVPRWYAGTRMYIYACKMKRRKYNAPISVSFKFALRRCNKFIVPCPARLVALDLKLSTSWNIVLFFSLHYVSCSSGRLETLTAQVHIPCEIAFIFWYRNFSRLLLDARLPKTVRTKVIYVQALESND